MQKDFATLGDLTVAFGIPCIKILSIDVAEEANQHGVMTLEAVIPESVTQDDVLCCEDSVIAVMGAEGRPIFSGYVSEIYLSHTAQYQEMFVTAYSSSIQADRSRESETFQSEGKTLAQVARVIMEPLGIQLSIPQDVALPKMLSRENETAWEFVRRIANEQGLYLYVDSKSLTPHISIGLVPFSVFPYDCFQFQAERKSISDYLAIQTSTGKQISAFQTAEQRGVTRELQIGAGYELVGETREYAVVRSRIQNDGDLLVNELTLTDPIGAAPKDGKSTLLQSTVLTGSVLAVQGVEVLVKFDKDGPAAGTRWIPYENTINNYFYCMPSEGDKVFAYYQNDGTIICLGSKWGQDLPDFADHKDHMLVNQSHMIKAGTKRLDFVLDRDYLKPEHYQKTHISFVQDKGIEIASTGSIEIKATEEICISSRPVDWQDSGELDQMIQSKNDAFTSGDENYQSHGGDGPQTPPTEAEKSAAAHLLYANMMWREFKNNIVVSTVMNFFGGESDSEVENAEEALQEPFSSGIVNMCASEYMELVVGTSNIQMTSNGLMTFSAEAYDMYGKERKNYERVELENYTARDKFLDGLQAVLGFVSIAAWLIPAPAGPIIAIAADLTDAAISVNRGDMLGAGLACCGVIGDVAKGLGMVDKATTAGKALNAANKALGGAEVAQKAGRIENIFGVASMVAIPVSIAQNGYALYQDVQAEGWTTENKNKFDALMFTAARQSAQMLFTTSLKNRVDAVTGSRTRAPEGDGAPPAKSSGGSGDGGDGGGMRPKFDGEKGPEGQRKNNEDKEGDPVDPITGSFTAEQTDFILPDIVGEFRLMRRHESLKRHERQLLGDRWLSSIGMRLEVQGDRAIMLKEDLYEEHFERTAEGWVNCWGGTQAYVLREESAGYKITETADGKTYCYNQGGCLTAVIDPHGNRMEITYCGTTIQRLTLASGQ